MQKFLTVPRLRFERFRNEAVVFQYIKKHTSISVPQIKAVFDDDDTFYFVMKYINEIEINELINAQKTVMAKKK